MTKFNRILSAILIITLLSVGVISTSAKTNIPARAVKLTATKVTLAPGDIATLSAITTPANATTKLKWKSNKIGIATVNSYGVITAQKVGTATISVRTSNGKSAKCTVTVRESLTKAEVEKLISGRMIPEETIKQWIGENDTLSAEEVKQLIAVNTLSESDVKKLISENTTAQDEDSWADGTEVRMISAQTLPLYISDPDHTGIAGQITSIKMVKNRASSTTMHNGKTTFLPFRYDVILTATVNNMSDAQKSTHCIKMNFGAIDQAADIAEYTDNNAVSVSGTTMTQLITLHSAYDINEYFVEEAVWGVR